ncbi:PREDICTED: uncharacterized protein LOC105117149 [Populus euphratica]|uniref:Uncharacterized protein LOC105117149 n=1 Tax=Populus euphratica TaxID=75702 RepID=A0AAJ6XC40_POPEU|nr:PREDICTED: uncharacterized protein LOC105117149 [Populus euphratica]
MKEIVSGCPACCELVDNRGWNALHYAVATKDREVFKECMEIPELARLKTKKDDKGNTPFHLIAALALKLDNWLLVFRFREEGIYGLNKQKLSIKDIYNGRLAEIQEILESLEDVGKGPFGCRRRIVLEETNEKNKKEKDASNKA